MAAAAHLKWKLPSQLYSPLVTSPRHYQLLARPRAALTLPHAVASLTCFFSSHFLVSLDILRQQVKHYAQLIHSDKCTNATFTIVVLHPTLELFFYTF